jgi:hypothetical protein
LTSLLVVLALGLEASGQGKDKDKKFEVPKDAIAGKVKSVDMKAPSFTITVDKGKDRTFLVDKATEFWGPRGGDRGTGAAGLKDDCMAPGYDIKVMPAKDGKPPKTCTCRIENDASARRARQLIAAGPAWCN